MAFAADGCADGHASGAPWYRVTLHITLYLSDGELLPLCMKERTAPSTNLRCGIDDLQSQRSATTAHPAEQERLAGGKFAPREEDKPLFVPKEFAARGNRAGAAGLSLQGEMLHEENKMRILAVILGTAAAIAVAAPVSADPAAGRVQLAQAQDSGAQSGSGMGVSQQGSAGNRDSGAATSRGSEGGNAATRGSEGGAAASQNSGGGRATMRSETGSSRTTIRARSGGARVAVGGSSRRAIGVRSATSDDAVIIKRKKARRYVYSEPSTVVIRKKRRHYTTYQEPSSAVIVKKRRAGVAVGGGVSTRTTVRSRTSTTVGGSSTTRERVGAGANVRERTSGQGNAGAGAGQSTEGRAGQGNRAPTGARSGGGSQSEPSGSGDSGQSPSGQR
jgi:hypothetical protein